MFRHITGVTLLSVLLAGQVSPARAQFDAVGPGGLSRLCGAVWSDPLPIPPTPQPTDAPTEVASSVPYTPPPSPPPLPWFDEPTVLPWQRSPITAVAYSQDDRYIVTGSVDGLVQLWTEQGEPIGFPFGNGEVAHIELVGFSADGNRIIVGDRRGWLRQWDLSGNLLFEVATQVHDYAAVAWDLSPDRTQVAVGSLQGDLQLWAVDDPRSRRVARAELGDSPYAIAFSPAGTGLVEDIAVGMREGEVRFFDGQLQPSRPVLYIVADTVTGLSWYPGTRILAVRDRNGVIRVVDATDRPFTPALIDLGPRGRRPPFGYSPVGELVSLAAVAHGRQAPLLVSWNIRQRFSNSSRVDRGDPTAFTFAADGSLAAGNADCTLRLWDSDLQPVTLPFYRPGGEVAVVAESRFDGDRWLQWSVVVDTAQQTPFGPVPAEYRINQWASDGTLLDTAALDFVSPLRDIEFDRSAQQLATLGTDGPLMRWGLDGALLGEFEVGDDPWAMALHPDGETVVVATNDEPPAVTLWSLAGERLSTLLALADRDRIDTLAMDPRGEIVAVGVDSYADDAEQLFLLSTAGAPLTPPIVTDQAGHYTLTFSPDGSLIAAGDSDGQVLIWTRNGDLVSQFSLAEMVTPDPVSAFASAGEEAITINSGPRIFSFAFSPDNALLASVDSDDAVRLWTVEGTYLGNLWPDDTVSVNDVRFAPDGRALLLGSEAGVHRWWLPATVTATRRYPVPPTQPLLLDSPFAPEPEDAGIDDVPASDGDLFDPTSDSAEPEPAYPFSDNPPSDN